MGGKEKMSEESKETNKKIDENKIAETIDNAMMRALKDFYLERLKEMILEKLEHLEERKKSFRIITKDDNVIIANHFDHTSIYDKEVYLYRDNYQVAQIKYETIKDIYEW